MSIRKSKTAASGVLTLAQDALTITVASSAEVTVACTAGSWGATTAVTFEVSVDGTNWKGLAMRDTTQTATATRALTALANGTFTANVAPYKKFRARLSVVDAGPVTVKVFTADGRLGARY